MRKAIFALLILLGTLSPAAAQVSVSIGINVPVYPHFVRVPGYPVYYTPDLRANYFFYDGAYWVFDDGRWYVSTWYNGPWTYVDPYNVPLFILRIPVRYYTSPPTFFHGWRRDEPPHWGQHWGREWEQRHGGWNHWDRKAAPKPAPLPRYQRNYSGNRYPGAAERQRELERRNYRYQPHEPTVRRHYEERGRGGGPSNERGRGGEERGHGRGR